MAVVAPHHIPLRLNRYKRSGDRTEWVHTAAFAFNFPSFEDTTSEGSSQIVQNDASWALFKGAQPGGEKGVWSSLFQFILSCAPWRKAACDFYFNSYKGPIWATSCPL